MLPRMIVWLAGITFSFLPVCLQLFYAFENDTWSARTQTEVYRDLLFASIVIGGFALSESFYLMLCIDRKEYPKISNQALIMTFILLLVVVLSAIRYGSIIQNFTDDPQDASRLAWIFTGVFCISSCLASLVLKACESIVEAKNDS